MDTQTALSTQSDDTANAPADAAGAALEPPPSNEDLLPFYLLAMAGAY
ncbi:MULTISPECIES: hypothetical protein [Paraburkholderia]|jgi:hypothetical protein|uniref:Uncharacterized protein n=1 Tax=Paraburkholderia dipogonis TaxID=1211383 RepID=A0ABW9APR0_9BURK